MRRLELRQWLPALCATLGVASLLYLGAALWAGSAATADAIARIGLPTIVAGTVVCTLSLLVRCLRWSLLLAWLGHRLPWRRMLHVYLAGLALSSTPGKLGETVRSALLMPSGVPVPRSLGAFFADRLSDVVGVALIGAVAGIVAMHRQPVLEVFAVALAAGALAAALALRSPRVVGVIDGFAARHRRLGWLRHLPQPAIEWATAWRGGRWLGWTAFAIVAFGLQAAVFTVYVRAVAPGFDFATAAAIFSSSLLIGAASMVPGGLGAMDSALVLQLRSFGVSWPDAVGVTLATRLSTLWFAWLIGLAALAGFAGVRPAAAHPADAARASTTP